MSPFLGRAGDQTRARLEPAPRDRGIGGNDATKVAASEERVSLSGLFSHSIATAELGTLEPAKFGYVSHLVSLSLSKQYRYPMCLQTVPLSFDTDRA